MGRGASSPYLAWKAWEQSVQNFGFGVHAKDGFWQNGVFADFILESPDCFSQGAKKSSNSKESSEHFPRIIWTIRAFYTKWRVLVRIRTKKFTRTSPKTWEDKFLWIPFLASTCVSPLTRGPTPEWNPPEHAWAKDGKWVSQRRFPHWPVTKSGTDIGWSRMSGRRRLGLSGQDYSSDFWV